MNYITVKNVSQGDLHLIYDGDNPMPDPEVTIFSGEIVKVRYKKDLPEWLKLDIERGILEVISIEESVPLSLPTSAEEIAKLLK